jgi:undecaprenyl-diphosphatase
MSNLEAIVLGIVQGLTEFLPISSSGHILIVPALFGWDDPGTAFTAVIQLGTMAAVLLYFRQDLWDIASTWLRSLRDPELRSHRDARMGWYLIIATIPISVLGLAFKDAIENGARDLYVTGSMLILFGLVLAYADMSAQQDRDIENVTRRDSIAIGLAQALALVPGVSRSGATISAGLLLGFDRAAAARFSFLLSIPAVVLSGLFELKDAGTGGASTAAVVLATLAAFVVGYAAIAWLLRYLTTHSLRGFVVYRLVVGAAVLVLTASGAISSPV